MRIINRITKKDVEALKKMIQEARPWYVRLLKRLGLLRKK